VLDCLAGEGPNASASLLAPFGRLVRIGRAAHTAISLPATTQSFQPDILQEARRRPQALGAILDCLAELVAGGAIRPPATRVFPSTETHSAFRWPMRAMHLGKIVLEMPPETTPAPSGRVLEMGRGPVLITGGLGALGLRVARRLAERGCRRLILVGRRAADSAWEPIAAMGVQVEVRRVDVSDREQVRLLMESLPDLVGVVHCAGVTDDAAFTDLTPERFARVWAPKAAAAWHLDEFAPAGLQFFVLFSSAASWVGNAGQANYAAANAELDALAFWRRTRGLPAVSIGWGPWAGGGMAADLERHFAADGTRLLDPEAALDAMEALIIENRSAAVVDTDWSRLAAALPALRWLAPSLAASAVLRPALDTLRAAASEVLRIPVARITGPLRDLGLDSIMATELRARVAGLPSVQALTGGITVEALAGAPEPVAGARAIAPRARVIEPLSSPAEAHSRLICFPFAGVGASFFRDWETPENVELLGVQYPGRGSRAAEAPLRRMEPLIRSLSDHLEPLLDRPAAFFGHCMGGLVAFLCARELRRRGLAPQHLFISGCPPPDAYMVAWRDGATRRFLNAEGDGREPIHRIPAGAFLDVLRFLDFAPARPLLREPGLLAAALPVIRADFEVCATWEWSAEAPLDLPITVFGGCEDPFFDRELDAAGRRLTTLDDWARQTNDAFESHYRPGDHYFLTAERAYMLDVIGRRLAWS
jgi:surfactin synthase thioesterase subunit/NAD(P)-dependent dehydrogenase (short-subunit alcohol dehydrogenase family)